MPPPVLSNRLSVADNLPCRLVNILDSCVFIVVELYRCPSPGLLRRPCLRLPSRCTWSRNLHKHEILIKIFFFLVFFSELYVIVFSVAVFKPFLHKVRLVVHAFILHSR